MANNRKSTVLLEYKIAKAEANAALNTTRRLADEIEEMRNEMNQIAQAGKQAGKGIDSAFNRSAVSNAKKLTTEIEAQNAALKQARKSLLQYNNDFDEIAKRQSLAGDVQSNLGAVRGITGVAGFSGLDKGIGAAGEIAVLAEELPRLKSALAGMPATVQSAVQALGAGGLAAGGGLLAGIALLGLAFKQLETNAQKAKERTLAGIDVQTQYIDAINTLSTGEAEQLIQQLEREKEARSQLREQLQQDLLATGRDIQSTIGLVSTFGSDLNRALSELSEQAGENGTVSVEQLTDALQDGGRSFAEVAQLQRDLTAVYGEGGVSVDTLRDTINALGTESQANENLIRLLTGAISDNRFAANDAAQAQRDLTAATLANASADAQRVRTELQLNQQSEQALRDRQTAIAQETAAVVTELAALRASGDETELVTQRIDALTAQLSTLSGESEYITSSAIELARAREAEAAAMAYTKRQLEETVAEVQQYNTDVTRLNEQFYEQRAALEKKYADQQIAIAEKAVEAASDALAKLEEQRADLAQSLGRDERDAQRDLQREQVDLQIKAQQDERDALRDHLRNLQDIKRKADEQEFEAILSRDFASLFKQRRSTNNSLDDANREFIEGRADRAQALADQRADLMTAFQQDRADRMAKYQQDLADAQVAYNKERQQIEINRRQSLIDARIAAQQEQRDLQANLTTQLNLRQQAATRELQMISQTEQQRYNIMAQTQAALIRQADQLRQAALTSAGRAVTNNVNNSRSISMPMTVTGGNPAQIEGAVTRVLSRLF